MVVVGRSEHETAEGARDAPIHTDRSNRAVTPGSDPGVTDSQAALGLRADLGLVEGHALVDADVAREGEDSVADDVALDIVGAVSE